ncbi:MULTISPECIES: FkbM family methyltransferase [Desulfovibrio]|uniref:Methyltransferase, FkbM family n=2 Tax=Desulfovibrio TaxID=872 RepID=A0AA94L344_DESDE|nr:MULTISPECIES: FkbM family methyltransferase [Desulfovibrio]SFW66778.1 methyltransferase, FkbM family [Desulfovibrio desulfuricans]SPD34256.1 S-adenosyl-L-methionine-dependent methyltransferase [Desulfovibrio sp. G11]
MNSLTGLFSPSELAALKKHIFVFSEGRFSSWDAVKDRQVVVFGAGHYGRGTIDLLLKEGVTPLFCVDADSTRIGTSYKNILTRPVAALAEAKNALVVLSSAYAGEMFTLCRQYPVETVLPIELPLASTPVAPIGLHMEEYEHNANLAELVALLDPTSREVLKNFLSFQFTLDLTYMQKAYTPHPYFDRDFLHRIRYDVFCDLGASFGDTWHDYRTFTPCGKKNEYTYYAVEPDLNSFLQLQKNTINDRNVLPLFAAISATDGMTYISTEGQGSNLYFVDERKRAEVPMRSLDSLFHRLGPKPTVIKADVEGGEANVLDGGHNLLRTVKPDLIFSLYHKKNDFYELPLRIAKAGAYELGIRQHTTSYGELMVYALAKERQ